MEIPEVSLREYLQKENEDLAARLAVAKTTIHPELLDFLVTLGMESERSAVVLGAERVHVSLEQLLKNSLRPSTSKTDELFTPQGALGSFYKKIVLAYRMELIDQKMRQALDIVRDLRNDFAHATKVESLTGQSYSDRVTFLWELMIKGNQPVMEGFANCFQQSAEDEGASLSRQAACYLSCIMQLLLTLELARHQAKRPIILMPAKFNFDDPD